LISTVTGPGLLMRIPGIGCSGGMLVLRFRPSVSSLLEDDGVIVTEAGGQ
jgi:hypothetical protein